MEHGITYHGKRYTMSDEHDASSYGQPVTLSDGHPHDAMNPPPAEVAARLADWWRRAKARGGASVTQ